MAETATDLKRPFMEVYEALNLKEQRKAMRGALRREANKLKKAAVSNVAASGLGRGTRQSIAKSIRTRVYPRSPGFMVTVKPFRKKGYHLTRTGKEKPVLMWAEDGTAFRKTKTQTKFFIRKKKGHSTGRMKPYRFMKKTEDTGMQDIENDLFQAFQSNLEKALKKKNLI